MLDLTQSAPSLLPSKSKSASPDKNSPVCLLPVGMSVGLLAKYHNLYFARTHFYLSLHQWKYCHCTSGPSFCGLLLLFILGINFIREQAALAPHHHPPEQTLRLWTHKHLRSFKKQSRKPYFVCCVGCEDTFIYHNNKDNSIKTPIIVRYQS